MFSVSRLCQQSQKCHFHWQIWCAREDLKRDLHFALLLKNSQIGCLYSLKQASCFFCQRTKMQGCAKFLSANVSRLSLSNLVCRFFHRSLRRIHQFPQLSVTVCKKTYTHYDTNATQNQKFVPNNQRRQNYQRNAAKENHHARRQAEDDCPFLVHTRTSRTAPLLPLIKEPNLSSNACATAEMTGRRSVLS